MTKLIRYAALFALGLAIACEERSTLPPADVTPPARIEDLTVRALRGFEVELGWSAPGDDDSEGRASAYSVRYSTERITETGWDTALVAASPPRPQPPGKWEVLTLSPLARGSWYFAVKTADDVPNWSALSNVVSITVSAPPDTIPPSAVADLAAESASVNSVTLGWTSPGDDGPEGRASVYDLRYAPTSITDQSWDDAIAVEDEPAPDSSGTATSMRVENLETATTYFFALRTADDAFNWSALSNVLSAATFLDTIPPDPVADLTADSGSPTSVRLTWTAPGDDGSEGRASAYDVRYALATITEKTWHEAMAIDGEPTPETAGAEVSFTAEGITVDTTYHFAIRTGDEVPNWSALSNVATVAPDTTPPSDVTNLRVVSGGVNAVSLRWTAPGDDDDQGHATTYDLRYALAPITEESWGAATRVPDVPSPNTGGAIEDLVVTDLGPEAVYSFALRTRDEVHNWSGLSNRVEASTVALMRLTTNPSGRSERPAWSPDGRRIAFTANTLNSREQVWVIAAAGGNPTQVTFNRDFAWNPSWSPDGTRIAYATHRYTSDPFGNDPSGLVVQAAEPMAPVTLAAHHRDGEFVWGSSWSPDGREIAYAVWVELGSPFINIKAAPSDGIGAPRLVIGRAKNRRPSWSPDGSEIAFESNLSGNFDIWVVSAAGGPATQLTFDAQNEGSPWWSPDGSRIAFSSSRSGNGDIWIMSSKGGDVVPFTFDPADDFDPAWSPDGRAIAFTSWREGGAEIWIKAWSES